MGKDIEKLRKQMGDYAKKVGIKLNPDKKQLNSVLLGILKRKEKFGEIYCPCRVITRDKKKDKDIICPCIYHKDEVKTLGHCKCKLFVK